MKHDPCVIESDFQMHPDGPVMRVRYDVDFLPFRHVTRLQWWKEWPAPDVVVIGDLNAELRR